MEKFFLAFYTSLRLLSKENAPWLLIFMVDPKVSLEQAYSITSLPVRADTLAKAARAYWSVENSCHRVMDVTFNEDQSRIRRGEGAHNLAVLCQWHGISSSGPNPKPAFGEHFSGPASMMTSVFRSLLPLVNSCVCVGLWMIFLPIVPRIPETKSTCRRAIQVAWLGMFENLKRAGEHFELLVPATIAVIYLLLLVTFGSQRAALLLLLAIPSTSAAGT